MAYTDDGKIETFIGVCRQLRKDEGLNKAQALLKATRGFPLSHQAWLPQQLLGPSVRDGRQATIYIIVFQKLECDEGLSKIEAMVKAARDFPKAYAAYKAEAEQHLYESICPTPDGLFNLAG